MTFIHKREQLSAGDVVVVVSSHQCNVPVMTDIEYQNYQQGKQFRHLGGNFQVFPARIIVPHAGYWNTTLDLGGGEGNLRYSINYIKQQ